MIMNKKTLLSGTGVIIAAILATAIIILANSTLTSWRLDLTENKLFTLSEGTLNIIRGLDEPVSLDFYISKNLMRDVPQLLNYANRVHDLLEEYVAKSNGNIQLNVIEPESFSEEEDRAVAEGMQGAPVNASGDLAYFGLVGTNTIDSQLTIPFFQNNREEKLEYDLTKLIYSLANPAKRTVGVLSYLPVFANAMPQGVPEWAISQIISEFFDIRVLDSALEINQDLDLLLIIHPKYLSEVTVYAIDQYLLAGGKAIFFVDPLAEGDTFPSNPEDPYSMETKNSDINELFSAWGIDVLNGQVAADMESAMRVQLRTTRGFEETNYLPWLKLDEDNLNQDDFVTSELNSINMGSSGIIEQLEGSTVTFTPLFETSSESMKMSSALLEFQRDPADMLSSFVSGDARLALAARISGKATTAYPDGMPDIDIENPFDEEFDPVGEQLTEGDLNVVLVADTDILADSFWISQQNFFGVSVPQPIADNGNFLINAMEHMSGSSDLISLRNRGEYSRPFDVVDEIRRDAETEFRQQEQILEAALGETERKIAELQQERTSNDVLLSPEQEQAIENFRLEQLNTRKELRAVQFELQKNVAQLGTTLKFINIGLVPLLIVFITLVIGFIRTQKKAESV
jgi:ABC-type uncharacterized transport system involved in gliding motility auxiliary subunit